jgi:hypothetical protein
MDTEAVGMNKLGQLGRVGIFSKSITAPMPVPTVPKRANKAQKDQPIRSGNFLRDFVEGGEARGGEFGVGGVPEFWGKGRRSTTNQSAFRVFLTPPEGGKGKFFEALESLVITHTVENF